MTATARQVRVTDADLEASGGASYSTLEVPQDYSARLEDVDDHNGPKGPGWKLRFRIEGLPFDYYVSLSDAARWKLIETVEAFEPGFFDVREPDGTTRPIDPNSWVGMEVGAHVILDEALDTPRKAIDYIFELPAVEPSVDDVPTL